MSKTTAMSDEDFPDHEFERSVHKAMRLCGWLLPRTDDELRLAEAELATDPVKLPESLRDPFRILDRLGSAATEEQPSPTASAQVRADELQIPSALLKLANDFGLTVPHVTSLMAMQGQIVANRSATRNDAPTYDDWKRLYESVKEFLQ
jgi:hypothetical protein